MDDVIFCGHLFSVLTLSEPPGSPSNCPLAPSGWSHGPVGDPSASRCRGGDDAQLPRPQGEATPRRGHLGASASVSESAEEKAHAQVWTRAWTSAELLARLRSMTQSFLNVICLEKRGAAGVASLCVCPHTSARGRGGRRTHWCL